MSAQAPIVKVRPRVTATEIQFWWSPPAQLWIATGYDAAHGVTIASSTDGLNWTNATENLFPGGDVYGIAWNGSYWLAGGYSISNEGSILKSTDGLTWIRATNDPFVAGKVYGVAWNGSYWVAVGYSPTAPSIATSSDGMVWTNAASSELIDSNVYGVAWNNSLWVAVLVATEDIPVTIVTSTNGSTWTASTNNPFAGGQGSGIAWNGSYWIAVGNSADFTTCISKSINGSSWTGVLNNPFAGGQGFGIAWNGAYWLAGGRNGDGSVCIAKSYNGSSWYPSADNPFAGNQCRAISWNGTYWVAVGANGDNATCVATSTDGSTWTISTNNPFTGGTSFAVANNFISTTDYVLESVSPAITRSVSSTTTTFSGLTPLTDYSFTIKTNLGGSYSALVPFRTVRTANRPAPVATLTKSQSIVDGLLTVTFSWTNPADYAYYYVYGLLIANSTQDTLYAGKSDYATLSRTFTGLDPARAYGFHIQRGNDGGYSASTSIITTAAYFDPTTVAGLRFWVDATDVSGNGATVADGTVIATWKDKSGTTNNATATAGATLQTDPVGRYLNFTGTSWYSLAQSSWAYNQYITFFVVDKPVNYDNSYTLISNQVSSTDSLNITYNATDGIRFSTAGDNAALGNGFQNSSLPIEIQPANVWCFTNYGGKTAYWNKLISGKAVTDAFITDTLLSIGAFQGSTNRYNGRMREILMYSGVMSETDREAITTYLYNKWLTPPTTIPQNPVANGTILWLDAQDITTFYQDLGGTIPTTENDTDIKRWNDKSGFGNDIWCMDGSYRSYIIDGINGLPAFYTNESPGADNVVRGRTTGFRVPLTGDATLFLVARRLSAPSFYFKHDADGRTFGFGGDTAHSWHESATTNNNQFSESGNPFIFYGTMQKSQLLSGTYIDLSGVQTSYTIDTLSMTIADGNIRLGIANLFYGEVIYYNRVLTDTEIQTNAIYLSNKWRIAIPPVLGFSPPRISGLSLWLDSSDPYTVFETGDVLTVWKDRSGNGYNAMPHGSPTVNNGIIFNGSSQWLSLPDNALPRNNYSYYIVSKLAGASTIINAGSKDISGQMWVAVGTSDNAITTSFDGMVWTPAYNNPFGTASCIVNGIAYNGSYWLAIGKSYALAFADMCSIAKSTDGSIWIKATDDPFNAPSGGEGRGIAWNGSYWLAIGLAATTLDTIVKSTDGMTWTPSTENPFSQGEGIAWNGSYWIAVGSNSTTLTTIAKSTDGMLWTVATDNPFSGGEGRGIAWNGSYWIAVGNSSSGTVCIAKSTDGMIWTAASNNPFSSAQGRGIAWNGSYWIAVGYNLGGAVCIAKSTDGMTWIPSTNNPFEGAIGSGIAWNGSYWVAVSTNGSGNTIATSTDGLIWTPSYNNPYSGSQALGVAAGNAPIHNSFMNITAATIPDTTTYLAKTTFDNTINNGKTHIVVSDNGAFSSADGKFWFPSSSTPFNGGIAAGIAYNGSYFVAVGSGTANQGMGPISVSIIKSYDGLTWSYANDNLFSGGQGRGIAWNGSYWIAVGNNAGATVCIVKSDDGITWTPSTDNPFSDAGGCYGIAWNGSYWVAGASNITAMSSDGMLWTSTSEQPFLAIKGIAWSGIYWLAVGTGDETAGMKPIAKSFNGYIWDSATTIPNVTVVSAAWNGTYWVAASDTGYYYTSTNGMVWVESSNIAFPGGFGLGITWNGSYWIATGYSESVSPIATSTDGSTWTPSINNPFTGSSNSGVAYAANLPFKQYSLTDTNIIPDETVIIESIYNNTGKRLFLSGKTGPTDTSPHVQDASNNLIGKDLSGNYMNGIIKEILVYNTAHTVQERKQVELYLKKKWYRYAYTPTDTSLWLDSDGASNFTLSGSSVQVWKDKSAQLTNYSQSYKWAQPLYSLDSVTGRYGVQFGADAIATGLTSAVSPFGTTDSWSVFAVQRYDYSTDQQEQLSGNICTAYKAEPPALVPGWLAVGSIITKSMNGTTWYNAPNNPFDGGVSLAAAWNGSYWLATGTNGGGSANTVTMAKSYDGSYWISESNPFTGGLGLDIAWNGSYWLATGANAAGTVCITKSTDGSEWTDISNTQFPGGVGTGIAWNGSYWVAVGASPTNNIVKSTNGVDWTPSATNPFSGGETRGIAWNGSYWLAVGNSIENSVSIAKSSDGSTWESSTDNPFSGANGFCNGVAWNGSYWVAVGQNPDLTVCIAKSTNGMTWTDSSNNPFNGGDGSKVAWNGSLWVAVGNGSENIATSTNGSTWTASTNDPFSGSARGIAVGNVAYSPIISLGTTTTAVPSISELNMAINGASLFSTVEIHKRPVLTSQVVTSLLYEDFFNGTVNTVVQLYDGMTSVVRLKLGYTGTLTPALAGAMRGYIYELIAFNTAIGIDERQSVEGYLAWKWGIQDLLASTHPYYLAPP